MGFSSGRTSYEIQHCSKPNRYMQHMEQSDKIISRRKISSSIFTDIYSWFIPIIIICGLLFSLYSLSTDSKSDTEELTDYYQTTTTLLFKILFSVFSLVGIYFLYSTAQRLKVIFYQDPRSAERKKEIIEKLKNRNKWKLIKEEKNYFYFWENNFIGKSYYITIVFDKSGFYINSYSQTLNLFDCDRKRRCYEIYMDIRSCI